MFNSDFEAQGRGSTFTLCHDYLKKAISLGKLQKVGMFCTGLYSALQKKLYFFGLCLIKQLFSKGSDRG